MWKMLNDCKEQKVQNTGMNYLKHIVIPYVLKGSNDPNILAGIMENHLVLLYTTSLINCHCKNKVLIQCVNPLVI